MIEYVVATLAIAVIYIFVKFYLIPKRTIKWYQKNLQKVGLKVKTFPFVFLGSGMHTRMEEDGVKHGDFHYTTKTDDINYDVILSNTVVSPEIYLTSPQLIKQFYSPEKKYYYEKVTFMWDNFMSFLGKGIIFSQKDIWQRKRKIITQVFNFDMIKSLVPNISNNCNQQFKRAELQYGVTNKKYKVNLTKIFSRIFCNVVIESFFGTSVKNQKIRGSLLSDVLIQIISDLGQQQRGKVGLLFGQWIYKLGLTQFDRSLNHRIKELKNICHNITKKRFQEINIQQLQLKEKGKDVIQNLMKNQCFKSKKQKGSQQFDIVQLNEEFTNFLLAGTDTTSNFLTTLVYFLIKNPLVMEKLRAQVDRLIKSDDDITFQKIKDMQYLQCVQKQTIRMHCPASMIFDRKVVVDHQIHGVPLKQGAFINYLVSAIHYNPKYFPEPFQFKPQRWVQKMDDHHSFTFIGFGGGPRGCIGKQLALLESKVTLIKLLKRYSNLVLQKQKINSIQTFLYVSQEIQTELQLR